MMLEHEKADQLPCCICVSRARHWPICCVIVLLNCQDLDDARWYACWYTTRYAMESLDSHQLRELRLPTYPTPVVFIKAHISHPMHMVPTSMSSSRALFVAPSNKALTLLTIRIQGLPLGSTSRTLITLLCSTHLGCASRTHIVLLCSTYLGRTSRTHITLLCSPPGASAP